MFLPLVFGKGLLLGLSIAAPVGPIGVLCIRRTLTQGRLIGFVSGCGAATADAVYGAIAAFGLNALSDFLVAHTTSLQLLGGLFLCYLGLKPFFAKPSPASSSLTELSISSRPNSLSAAADRPSTDRASTNKLFTDIKACFPAYTTTLALTITNPATIIFFLSIFVGLGITQGDYLQSVTLVFGVFSGSLLWWLVLVSGVAYLRRRLTPARLTQFNAFSSKVFGLVITGFGGVALFASIRAIAQS